MDASQIQIAPIRNPPPQTLRQTLLKGEVESFDGMGNRHRAGPMDCLYIPAGVPHGVRTVGDMDLELVWLHDAIERNGVSIYLDGPGPFPAEEECTLIAYRNLAPDWDGEGAKAGGTLRWCINWVAGQGRNHNPAEAALNPKLGIGMTAILPGNSGVTHSHQHPETYLVLSGDGAVSAEGETAHLGRLDAAYFPAETPHVIRNTGDQTLHVLWAHELG